MIGQTIGGYRILEQIGQGGMARVYKAYDPTRQKEVALKILPEVDTQDPRRIQRFKQEARTIASLRHPHIIPLFDFGEDRNTLFLVMPYMPYGTLADRMTRGPLRFDRITTVLPQIASALDHAHAHGILHRDIKPSNILLDGQGNAYLTDFGVAKMVESDLDLTKTGGLLGTPAYMSPEQCMGEKKLSPATDQYSLGIVLYEMVTGRTPYQAETPLALVRMQVMSEPMPLPHTLRRDLPAEAERVILKTLAKDPGSRFPDCLSLSKAFNSMFDTMTAGRKLEEDDSGVIADDFQNNQARPIGEKSSRDVLEEKRTNEARNLQLQSGGDAIDQPIGQFPVKRQTGEKGRKSNSFDLIVLLGSILGQPVGFVLYLAFLFAFLNGADPYQILNEADANHDLFIYLSMFVCGLPVLQILLMLTAFIRLFFAQNKNKAMLIASIVFSVLYLGAYLLIAFLGAQ